MYVLHKMFYNADTIAGLSYMPSGIISDIETVLNTHLIAQRKQKRWNAYSLGECWFLAAIKTKRATQCDSGDNRAWWPYERIIGARLDW